MVQEGLQHTKPGPSLHMADHIWEGAKSGASA